jgi:hypothetical protein
VVVLQIRIGDGRVVEDLVIERLLAVPFETEEEEREWDHGIEQFPHHKNVLITNLRTIVSFAYMGV